MAVVVIIIITERVIMMVIAVSMAAMVVMAPGKGFRKNPEKSSPRKKGGFPSGLLI